MVYTAQFLGNTHFVAFPNNLAFSTSVRLFYNTRGEVGRVIHPHTMFTYLTSSSNCLDYVNNVGTVPDTNVASWTTATTTLDYAYQVVTASLNLRLIAADATRTAGTLVLH